MGKLEGKVAVITGGSSGMALASAKRFVEEDAYVFITGRRQEQLDEAVKATGRVNNAPTRQTPAQRALRSVKQRPVSSQSAHKKRKMVRTCQQKIAVAKGRWEIRMEAATTLGNQVALACD